MTNYNDGNWHGWNGGECPVHPDTVVEFLTVDNGYAAKWCARDIDWYSKDNPVVAFRVIKEHKEPREFWVLWGETHDSLGHAESRRQCMAIKDKNYLKSEIIHVREVLE